MNLSIMSGYNDPDLVKFIMLVVVVCLLLYIGIWYILSLILHTQFFKL